MKKHLLQAAKTASLIMLAFAFLFTAGCKKNTTPETPQQKNLTFRFEMAESSPYEATVRITPSENGIRYIPGIMTAGEYATCGKSGIPDFVKKAIEKEASDKSAGFEEILESVIRDGICTVTATASEEKNLVAYAYPAGNDGTLSENGEISVFEFSMQKMFTLSFTIDKGVIATVTADPADKTARYFFDVLTDEQIEQYGNGNVSEAMQAYLDEQIALYAGILQKTPEEIVSLVSSTGKKSHTYETGLMPETKYRICVCNIDKSGKITSPVETAEMTTTAVEPSDNTITLSVEDLAIDGATVHAKTTNNDPYLFTVLPASEFEGLDDNSVMKGIVQMYGQYIPNIRHCGNATDNYSKRLKPGTKYMAYAFGYMGETVSTKLFSLEFTTPDTGDGSGITFRFETVSVTSESAEITIIPSDETVPYVFNIMKKGITKEDVLADLHELADFYVEMGMAESFEAYLAGSASSGKETASNSHLEPATAYTIYCWALNADGTFATEEPFIWEEGFTTK